jgi:hypothetical protein
MMGRVVADLLEPIRKLLAGIGMPDADRFAWGCVGYKNLAKIMA